MTASTSSPGASLSALPAQRAMPIRQVPCGISLDTLPVRELKQHELVELTASLAEAPRRWHRSVAFHNDARHFTCLHRDANVDVWLICWTPSNDTGWHDHDLSSGAVAVVRGRLIEHNLALGQVSVATEVRANHVYSFGPDHIHRLVGGDAQTVSIHAYSPPLWRMGQYAVSPEGVLRRVSVCYADELRPIDR
jgi:hypothetical protein